MTRSDRLLAVAERAARKAEGHTYAGLQMLESNGCLVSPEEQARYGLWPDEDIDRQSRQAARWWDAYSRLMRAAYPEEDDVEAV